MRVAIICEISTLVVATFFSSLAWAQDAGLIHIPSGSAPIFREAEWTLPAQDPKPSAMERVLIAEGNAATSAPLGASQYAAQEYSFPAGALRVLKWSAGPVVHQITFETQLYMLKGSATVGVDGKEVAITAGDAVFQPSGTLRNDDPRAEIVVLSFIVSSTSAVPKARVVRGNGRDAAAKFKVKHYAGDGNSIRHVVFETEGRVPQAIEGQADILVYVISGRLRRVVDGVEHLFEAGDAIREGRNTSGYWEILEKSEIIVTDMPFDPSKPRYKLQRSLGAVAGPSPAMNKTKEAPRDSKP